MLVPEPCVPYWLNDATKLQSPHGGTGQQGREQEVVPRADDDHIKELLVYVTQYTVAPPSRAQNHQPLSTYSTQEMRKEGCTCSIHVHSFV